MDASPTLALSRAFGLRAVRLVEALRTPDDLSPAHVERAFGLPIEHDSADARRFGCGQVLDPRWICNLSSLPDRDRADAPPRLMFSFDDQTGAHDDWSDVCGLDFDEVAAAFADAGYARAPITGPRDAFSGFRFRRGPIAVDVEVRGESAYRPDHLCVARMLIESVAPAPVAADVAEVRHDHA